ncbi:hypothetical protein [Cetobacterium sp. SF1]|uniref:hypothetical protein n=1 Tax=Cetobacterium sp. SF1 TaxID=3417654 RepID=UPI003CEF677A
MLVDTYPNIPRTSKLIKVTLHLDEVIANYLKDYSKQNRLTMSYIIEALIASTQEFKEEKRNG